MAHAILFCASWDAILRYVGARFRGEPLDREDPARVFPVSDELESTQRRFGSLLRERLFLTKNDLQAALDVQKRTGQPLGATLVELGLAREQDVLEVLGEHLRLTVSEIDPYTVPAAVMARLPADVAIPLGVFPVGERGGVLQVATDRLIAREDVDLVERAAGGPVEIVLASRANVAFALRRRYRAGVMTRAPGTPLVGERLVTAGVLSPENLAAALRLQRQMFRRVGDIVVDQGWVDRERVEEAAADARARTTPIGQELRRRGWITEAQLDESLRRQAETDRRLGDVLVEHGFVSRERLDEALETIALSA